MYSEVRSHDIIIIKSSNFASLIHTQPPSNMFLLITTYIHLLLLLLLLFIFFSFSLLSHGCTTNYTYIFITRCLNCANRARGMKQKRRKKREGRIKRTKKNTKTKKKKKGRCRRCQRISPASARLYITSCIRVHISQLTL